MRFYTLTDEHVMEMPVTRFWFLFRTISRLEADESISLFDVTFRSSGQGSADVYREYRKALVEAKGVVFRTEGLTANDQPDPDYREKLRRLASGR